MLEIIPENVDDAIVCNISGSCGLGAECEDCRELVIGIHNWLVASEQKYIILDFQDEKELCPSMVEELVQLRKRMPIPFLFAGVMERAKQLICSYDYRAENSIFRIPEDAIVVLKKLVGQENVQPELNLTYGEPINLIRSRYSHKLDYDSDIQDLSF